MEIMEKLQFDLELCGMSSITQKNYVYHVSKFAAHCGKELADVEVEDVRQFLHYLRNGKKLNIGTVNYYHTCLKFLFQMTLDKRWNDWQLPRLRGYRTLPVILAREEVKKVIASADNLKHKALLSTIYSGGLRISEACRLKVQDIDSKNMQLFIREAKGNKDRYTILSQNNLLLLREYWTQCGRPNDWLFPGQKPETHITPVTARRFLEMACKTAGISKKITVHTLRHCFATHMLEAGVSIFAIKILLGHASINSTCRYLHMVRQDAFKISSPLDYPDGDNDA
jgi:site-specific recombinase XerD